MRRTSDPTEIAEPSGPFGVGMAYCNYDSRHVEDSFLAQALELETSPIAVYD